MRSLSLVMSECSLSGRGQGHVSNFYIMDLENFARASRCKTTKATRMRHGRVHTFITHRPTLTLQLHNFDLFRTCRSLQVISALLRDNWRNFN